MRNEVIDAVPHKTGENDAGIQQFPGEGQLSDHFQRGSAFRIRFSVLYQYKGGQLTGIYLMCCSQRCRSSGLQGSKPETALPVMPYHKVDTGIAKIADPIK